MGVRIMEGPTVLGPKEWTGSLPQGTEKRMKCSEGLSITAQSIMHRPEPTPDRSPKHGVHHPPQTV